MARHGAVLDRRRSLADRDSVWDAATLVCLRRCVPRAPDWPSGLQMLHQLFFQHAARLHIKTAINGLVRHAPRLGLWICPLQPACNLLGRPVQLKLSNNGRPQLVMHRQFARLWAQRLLPRELVSRCNTVATHPAVATDLAADRRCCASQRPRYCPDRLALHNASRFSSRSAIVSAKRDRRRAGGIIPPLGLKCVKMQEKACQTRARSTSGLHPSSSAPKAPRSELL